MSATDARGERRAIEILNRLSAVVAGEPDLERAVQSATDAATELTGAEFGAFFYNVVNESGESYKLYTLSGVPRENFSKFPMPRNTALFAPTFEGRGVVRSGDIAKDRRYGDNAPHDGMPKGHLPVRSYLAVPVISRTGEVHGGLLLGHQQPDRFNEECELRALAVASHAAIAIDNARLFKSLQQEIESRKRVEEELRIANASLEGSARTRTQERDAAVTGARDASEQFRLLVQGVVDYAIYMLNPEGYVTSWNPGAERNKGYRESEILGQHFSVFYTPEARAAQEPQRALAEARDKGRIEMQGWRVRKGGARFWASVIIDAVYDQNGRFAGFAKVTRDITEQREAAQALEQAREALFQSQKMEAVGQLTGGIAHDFNNMLAGIIGAMNLLQRRLKAGRYEEASQYADAALDSANRAAALTSRLLAFGRRQSLDLKTVDVSGSVRAVETILRRSVGENIDIATDLAPDATYARSDAHQLESAVLNLALNARDAMPNGGRIQISTAKTRVSARDANPDLPEGEYVHLRVTDNGFGMSEEVRARAFEPFYTTKPIGSGTGLGLSMVYGFMKQSGGHARIESEPGKGTTISLYLPTSTPEAAVDDHSGPEKIPRGRGEIVLVVEDDTLVRTLVLDVLRDLGYQPREAADAAAAMPFIQSGERLDLLISDVGLPGMNGRQLADVARHSRPGLKVLFLTGYAEHAAIRSSFLASGMDLMTKPFAIDELAAKIQTILQEP